MKLVHVKTKQQRTKYRIEIRRGAIHKLGIRIRETFGRGVTKVVIASNPAIYELYGSLAANSLEDYDFDVYHWLMPIGERFKSLRTLENFLGFLNEVKVQRSDAIIALGGGVVGDLAGFAAAVHLRGVSLVQVPTTLLAQIDSSIGGKTGVNLCHGKNLVGAFHHPSLVVADLDTLMTLPQRELVGGFCEMVKQGSVSGQELFEETVEGLISVRETKEALLSRRFEKLIASHCMFKASIVAGDEKEDLRRDDYRSRRILNFGHTIAHSLESVTAYRRFRHGEAVGYGMIVAAEISKNLGLLGNGELKLLRETVGLCGKLPAVDDLDQDAILRLLEQDKKNVGGRLKWILLEGIGRPRIIDEEKIPKRMLRASIREGLKQKEVLANG